MNYKIADSKFKEILIPRLLMVMALNISSVVDSFFVGAFIGPNAVAALELLEPLLLLMTVFEWLFGLGGQIIAINKKSKFDIDGSNRYFTTSIVTTFIASLIMAIICFLFVDPFATVLGSSPATKPLVIQYSIFFGCFVVSTLVAVLTQYIRVDDQPKFASALIIIANIINIILDYVFLSSGMGMASASLASFIGYTVTLVICLRYIHNPKRTFRFVRSSLKIKTFIKTTWKMTKIGFPVQV